VTTVSDDTRSSGSTTAAPPDSLRHERRSSLEHGLELLMSAWEEFDVARPHQPPVSAQTSDLLASGLPATGVGVRQALDDAASILDQSLAQPRPRFFGYVGSSGLESAVLADALAASHDVNLAAESEAAHLCEQQALRWIGEFVGYPAAGGSFTSGGMLSNLTALMAARTRALPGSRVTGLHGARAVVYCSAEAHSSIERAAELLGLGRDGVRSVPLDSERRMRPELLAEMIHEDLAAGMSPVAVVATAGTTLTGAVDRIDAIADVCEPAAIWLHVDGAYGLPAASTELAGHLFHGLDRADSVSLDAHKWMFVPKACGIVLVRDQATLAAAFRHDSAYMVEEEGYAHPVDATLEYSRPFRSLKLWTALRSHGADAFRAAITTNLVLARTLAQLVRDEPQLELMVESPQLSVVPFRFVPEEPDVDVDELNLRLARALQADGRVYVTSAVVDGRACLRPCIVNFRTTEADIRALVDLSLEVGKGLAHA
jgi:aromatic-L-amino-acid decarboxylase